MDASVNSMVDDPQVKLGTVLNQEVVRLPRSCGRFIDLDTMEDEHSHYGVPTPKL